MDAPLETLLLAFSAEHAPSLASSCLVLGARPHPALREWPNIVGWQPFKPLAEAWERLGLKRIDEPSDGKWPMVLVLPGKCRDETLLWFAMARDRLEQGGTMLCAMPKSAGAARFEKELAAACGSIRSLQKHHCRAFWTVEDGSWDEAMFSAWRQLGGMRDIGSTGYLTQAGVFSAAHIDPGSEFLASHLPTHLSGHVADLGAGWGYLSDVVLTRCPNIARIDLFEADARALQCACSNLARHERGMRFHWHDVTKGLPELYDSIVMNPPFHSGQATDVELGRNFVTVAAASLRRGGALYLVANRQLPYETLLDQLRLSWRIAAENPTYKLLFAIKR